MCVQSIKCPYEKSLETYLMILVFHIPLSSKTEPSPSDIRTMVVQVF